MTAKVTNDEVVEYLRLTGQYGQVYRDLVMRKTAVAAAQAKGIRVTEEELEEAAEVIRARYGFDSEEDEGKWVEMSGLTPKQFRNFVETNALVGKWKEHLRGGAKTESYLQGGLAASVVRDLVFQDWLLGELKSGEEGKPGELPKDWMLGVPGGTPGLPPKPKPEPVFPERDLGPVAAARWSVGCCNAP
jgi:hypothetical protein